MTNTTQAPATITWRRTGETHYSTTRIDLAHGRSRGLTDIVTAQRVLAISKLGDLQLADQVMIVDVELVSDFDDIAELIAAGDIVKAQLLATDALAARRITCSQYVRLVKLSEGR